MYVHIGDDMTVIDSSICSIINLDEVSPSNKDINAFLKAEDESNRLEYLRGDIPKSLVLTKDKTYVSPVSSSVLKKRLNSNKFDLND